MYVFVCVYIYIYDSPGHAVSREGIAVSRTVARTAAVVMETPVSHHAPVAVGAPHTGLADTVSVGRVTERPPTQVEGY